MDLRSFLAELRRRRVLKVATAYLATGWVVIEAAGFLFQNFGAPAWAPKTFTFAILLGFPVVILLAWGLEFTEQGIRPTPPMLDEGPASPRRSDGLLAGLLVLMCALVAVSVAHDWRQADTPKTMSPAGPAASAATAKTAVAKPAATAVEPTPVHATLVVVIMDTPAPRGVYEASTRERSGTNADDLNELLRDLPISIHKETVGATWDREDQVRQQSPDLVLVHRSAFFHAMNLEFGFGYPGDESGHDLPHASRLYELADIRLISVLGYLGRAHHGTRFIVYSRGSGPDNFEEERGRDAWLQKVEGRFPFLKGRVTPLLVPGGTSGGSFEDPETARMFRQQVQRLLGLAQDGQP